MYIHAIPSDSSYYILTVECVILFKQTNSVPILIYYVYYLRIKLLFYYFFIYFLLSFYYIYNKSNIETLETEK